MSARRLRLAMAYTNSSSGAIDRKMSTRQITNAYRVHEPASGLGLLATPVFATESNHWTASARAVEPFHGAAVLKPTGPLHRALERLGALLESRTGAAPDGAAKGYPR
jgi:hypothetical protein